MDGRLSGSDYSLNATQSTDEEGREWIETLEDESEGADSLFEQAHDNAHLRKCLLDALSTLNERERLIVRERAIREDTRTLESLEKSSACQKSGFAKSKRRRSKSCASICKITWQRLHTTYKALVDLPCRRVAKQNSVASIGTRGGEYACG